MKNAIRRQLEESGERKYGEFSSALIPGITNILGIRLPVLRNMAKALAKGEGTAALEGEDIYFEETMLRGMIIGYLKLPLEERLELICDFVPRIDNWSICDSFCCSLKFAKKEQAAAWELIQPYAHSDKEFEQRFAAVMLLNYFINDTYIDRTLKLLAEIDTAAYYSSMAVAWTAAECCIKYREKSLLYIEDGCLDDDTLKRTVRKLCDSYRVDEEEKKRLKEILGRRQERKE